MILLFLKHKNMKNNLKKPCNECPFRKNSIKGWLGGETAQSTFDMVSHEVDFACHKTRHKEVEEMSRCRGFLLFTKKACKLPKYNEELKAIIENLKKPDTSNILSIPEFFQHHKKDI